MKRRYPSLNRFKNESFFFDQLPQNVYVQNAILYLGAFIGASCYVYQHAYVLLITYHFFRIGEVDFSFLTNIMTCLIAIVSQNIWLFKSAVFGRFNLQLRKHFAAFHDKDHEKECTVLPKSLRYVIAAYLYVFLAALLTYLSAFTYETNRDPWVETLCFGSCNATALSEAVKVRFLAMDKVTYTIGLVGCGALIQVRYVFHCNTLICFLNETQRRLADRAAKMEAEDRELVPLTRSDVITLRKKVKSGKHLLSLANDMYATVFFLWYGMCLFVTCQGTTELVKDMSDITFFSFAMYTVRYGQSFIWVIIVSYVSAKIPDKLSQSRQYTEEITIYYKDVPFDVFGEMNLLMHQTSTEPKGITVGGCFVITRSFFMSYIGVVFTYVVLIIQMTPDAVENIQKYTKSFG